MNDDTQPRPPQGLKAGLSEELPPEFREDLSLPEGDWHGQQESYYEEEYTQRSGPGCFMWVFVVLFIGLIGILVVVMAGAAGWTEGKRVADRNIEATSMAFIGRQFTAIETNVADLNSAQLATRIAFLATQTPAVPLVAELQQTALAVDLHLTATQEAIVNEQIELISQALEAGDIAQFEQRVAFLATQTPAIPQVQDLYATATAWAGQPTQLPMTPEPEVTTDALQPPTEEDSLAPVATTGASPTDLNLDDLLARAQQEISFNQLEQATRTLDLIIRLDETYQTQTVRRLMFDVLSQQATTAYQITLSNPRQTGTLAEAVRFTDQAERYGSAAQLGDLVYERELANLYLNAIAAMETSDYSVAIQRLERIRSFQAEYKGANINRLIFNQYVAYGDAFANYDRDFCRAAEQYRVALTLFADNGVSGKRTNAVNQCQAQQQAQQAPPPQQDGLPPTNEEGVAPIGVPGS